MANSTQAADRQEEDIICCRYCHRELKELSPYSVKNQIPMCEFCEVKHKEFEEIKKIRKESP